VNVRFASFPQRCHNRGDTEKTVHREDGRKGEKGGRGAGEQGDGEKRQEPDINP